MATQIKITAATTKAATKRARHHNARSVPQGDGDTLRWFIGMCYKTGLGLLVVLAICYAAGIAPLDGTLTLALVDLLYLATTAIYDFVLRKNGSARCNYWVRTLQLPESLLLCTMAVYLGGGVFTPMVLVYPIVVIQAIILADPRGVYRTGIITVALFCGLAAFEAYHIIPYAGGGWGANALHNTATPATYALYISVVSSLFVVTTYMGTRVAEIISTRNSRINSQLQDLSTLYDIANGLGNILHEDEMLRYLATTLKSLQNASSCVIGMVNKEECVEVKASAGVPPSTLARIRAIRLDTPGLAHIFEQGEPLIIPDFDKQPEYKPLLVNEDTRCAYIFPVKGENKVIGSISLGFNTLQPLSLEYSSLLTTVAVQAGVALQRAHLFTDTQRLAREMSVLYDVGLYTGSTLSKDEVIRRTAATIEKLLNPDAYYIALYDPESNMLTFEMFMECGQQMPRMKMNLNRGGLTGRIVETCKPLLVQDWLADGQQYNAVAQKTGVDMLSYLGVPMVAEDKVVGVISVQSEQPLAFDSHHERLLTALAAQTAMALENAGLHQLAQNQAKYDSLTKVYNHGYFVDLVRAAVENSDNNDACVALIMLDIDHFKQYNDTYGHVAGDNVLRMVANALKSSAREGDSVGRWGGEEFCVLLPGSGIQEAKKVARHIRRAIAELYPVDGHGQLIPNPTMSQGVSSYPYPSVTSSELIEEADAALYQAKKRGRNQLIVYEDRGVLKEATLTTGHLARSMITRETNRNKATITTGHLIASTIPVATQQKEAITTPRLS